MSKQRILESKAIDQTIRKNLRKLSKPGVLTVRPGYEVTGDQLTGRQAIVATVHTKKSRADLSSSDSCPTRLEPTRSTFARPHHTSGSRPLTRL